METGRGKKIYVEHGFRESLLLMIIDLLRLMNLNQFKIKISEVSATPAEKELLVWIFWS